jgi:hypothetical protein
MQWVSTLLARDDLHVCAVSPTAVGALRASDSMNTPLLMPHDTITVISFVGERHCRDSVSVAPAWC